MDSSALRREVVVRQENGLHLIPSSQIAQIAQSFRCDLTLCREGGVPVDAKSMMDLLTLAAEKGTRLTVEGQGEGAEEAVQALVAWFETP
ncbi:MAG: HPr family phosphocarrier protein [Planctomycetales bacterium]